MLYVVYGTDHSRARAKADLVCAEYREQGIHLAPCTELDIETDALARLVSARGLFGESTLVALDGVLEKKDAQESVLASLEALHLSHNIFVILDGALPKSFVDKVRDVTERVFEYALPKQDTRPAFNIFALGDALGARNKKDLWVLYQEALAHGISPEEISGTLFWMLKNLALIKDSKAGDDKGLSAFVARKVRGFVKNYSKEELQNLGTELTRLYHEAHRGGEPMDVALERWILSL